MRGWQQLLLFATLVVVVRWHGLGWADGVDAAGGAFVVEMVIELLL